MRVFGLELHLYSVVWYLCHGSRGLYVIQSRGYDCGVIANSQWYSSSSRASLGDECFIVGEEVVDCD